EEKGYDPLAYRLFCLGSHYRKNLTFSWEGLDGAASSYAGLVRKVAALKGPAKIEDGDKEEAARLDDSFRDALDSDLNTSMAVTALYDVFKAKIADGTKLALIGKFDEVLSLGLLAAAEKAKKSETEAAGSRGIDGALKEKIEQMIKERADAKAAKNYAEADRIRDELAAMGVTLVDSKEGTTYKMG
ncbi:MAG: cysteine--tRNA ligase, partial [Clostridia bacterium]|nr:cysteine--tRNA ligase [Clostridia bacterium]